MSKFRVFLVDDEGPARRKLTRFLQDESDMDIVGEAASGPEALGLIPSASPDLVFLDIQMPGMNGFSMLEHLEADPVPAVVFVTAYDQFALKAFEVHAFDYLLKPYSQTRLREVLDRVRTYLRNAKSVDFARRLEAMLAETKPRFRDHLLVSANERAFFLPVERIEWVEAAKNFVKLHVGSEVYTVRGTVEGLAAKLDPEKFLHVNRSRIVNIAFIKELQPWFHGEFRIILRDGTETMWSRRFLDKAPDLLNR